MGKLQEIIAQHMDDFILELVLLILSYISRVFIITIIIIIG